MEKFNYYPANSRGESNLGWLKSRHTFSFGSYMNSNRVHFGALRVINDDFVEKGMGFGKHGHSNMEIITIPLEGELAHSDSMGNGSVITKGDIQVMSAGTGIEHSEYNNSETNSVKFLQIWVIPNKENVEPRYDQQVIDFDLAKNNYLQILSPNKEDNGVWIHQNSWFHFADFDSGFEKEYEMKDNSNGLFVFVLSGKIDVSGQEMVERDGMEISGVTKVHLRAMDRAEILLMEVPV